MLCDPARHEELTEADGTDSSTIFNRLLGAAKACISAACSWSAVAKSVASGTPNLPIAALPLPSLPIRRSRATGFSGPRSIYGGGTDGRAGLPIPGGMEGSTIGRASSSAESVTERAYARNASAAGESSRPTG